MYGILLLHNVTKPYVKDVYFAESMQKQSFPQFVFNGALEGTHGSQPNI